MIKEAIILAGGLGTRLRSVVSDLPKCMAPVAGKPFLYYVIGYLKNGGIENFIFSVGYKSDAIQEYLNTEQPCLNYRLSIEKEPLGTGGAIKLACSIATEKSVLVVNGDTLFSIKLQKLAEAHQALRADCTLSLKPMTNFDRYGVVELNNDNSIRSFKEKQFYKNGLINGGAYALNVDPFLNVGLPEKFSFEKDFLEKYVDKKRLFGIVQDDYFIDIGIPEDYERANLELRKEIDTRNESDGI